MSKKQQKENDLAIAQTFYTTVFIFKGIYGSVWNFKTRKEAEKKAQEMVNSKTYGNDEDCDVFILSSKMNHASRIELKVTKDNNNG